MTVPPFCAPIHTASKATFAGRGSGLIRPDGFVPFLVVSGLGLGTPKRGR
jgi:hypothetical protein